MKRLARFLAAQRYRPPFRLWFATVTSIDVQRFRWNLAAREPMSDADIDAALEAAFADAAAIWDQLEAQPGFNESMRAAEAELAAGRGVRLPR